LLQDKKNSAILAAAKAKYENTVVGTDQEESVIRENLTEEEQAISDELVSRRRLQSRKPLFVGLTVLLLVVLSTSVYATVLRPRLSASSASVGITPISQTIVTNHVLTAKVGDADPTKNPIGAHRIARMLSSPSMKVPATGKGHQDAAIAHGTVTVTEQQGKLPANTNFHITSNSGQKIVFSLAKFFQLIGPAKLSAYAENPGSKGNIAPYDINGTYRDVVNHSLAFFVQNTQSFTGGQDASDYTFVQQSDIDTAASTLEGQLADSVSAAKAAIQRQLAPNEQFMNGVQCNPHVTPNHHENDKVQDVIVMVVIECAGTAYDVGKFSDLANKGASEDALARLGAGYALVGKVPATVEMVTGEESGTVTCTLLAHSVWAFQISQTALRRFATLIAGQSQTDTTTLLVQPEQGIAAINIQVSGGLGVALPSSAENIQVALLNVKGL